jgi:hypothetical protein
MTFILGDFSWYDPLSGLDSMKDRGLTFYAHHGYLRQLRYLEAIWKRLTADYRNVGLYLEFTEKMTSHSVGYTFSKEEMSEYQRRLDSILLLDLDYDSFIIHAKILMDKVSELTVLLLRNQQNQPPKTFSQQRKFFLRPENATYPPNQKYAEIVTKADWFELCLKTARDMMVVHSIPNFGGMMFSPREGKLRPLRSRTGWSNLLDVKSGELTMLKTKYETRYPELKKIDNYWLIADFFMNNDIELEKPDMFVISKTIRETGCYLPDLNYLATHVMAFLGQTAMAFGLDARLGEARTTKTFS